MGLRSHCLIFTVVIINSIPQDLYNKEKLYIYIKVFPSQKWGKRNTCQLLGRNLTLSAEHKIIYCMSHCRAACSSLQLSVHMAEVLTQRQCQEWAWIHTGGRELRHIWPVLGFQPLFVCVCVCVFRRGSGMKVLELANGLKLKTVMIHWIFWFVQWLTAAPILLKLMELKLQSP